jgi:hypothetical protein
MEQPRTSLLQKLLPSWTVFTILAVVYLRTIAPGLTWANGGSDGGDLITAAATGGVAHPTGYPLYLLLARLFQLLPVGSLAFRTNLMSALAMALAGGLLCHLVLRARPYVNIYLLWIGGMAAGFAFGLAPLVWSQAVITEVYALQALLVVILFHLYGFPTSGSGAYDCLRGAFLGLALTAHLTGLFLLPALLVGFLHRQGTAGSSLRRLRFDRAALLRQLVGLGAGLSLYGLLPLRALADPPINWGNVTSLERFWWLVSGQLYHSYNLAPGLQDIAGRVLALAALLLKQFGLAGIALSLVGVIVFGSPSRIYLVTAWTALASSAFAIFYGSVDSYVYLIPACLSLAAWLGLGLVELVDRLNHRSLVLGAAAVLLFLVFLAARSRSFASEVDASMDRRAERFAQEVLSTVPDHALVFAKGDRAVFSLWYVHFALGQRPDLVILAEDLLHFDWYLENLQATYPSLEVSGRFAWPETLGLDNPTRPLCTVEYRTQAEIHCRE